MRKTPRGWIQIGESRTRGVARIPLGLKPSRDSRATSQRDSPIWIQPLGVFRYKTCSLLQYGYKLTISIQQLSRRCYSEFLCDLLSLLIGKVANVHVAIECLSAPWLGALCGLGENSNFGKMCVENMFKCRLRILCGSRVELKNCTWTSYEIWLLGPSVALYEVLVVCAMIVDQSKPHIKSTNCNMVLLYTT